jgi:hypothetical protein
MPNKIIKTTKGVISIRIDDVFTSNEKHLLVPYIDQASGKERFFGSFKFLNPKEAKATLKEAVKMLTGMEDTIFAGQYPKWEEDGFYGTSLKVNGRVKFFKELNSTELVPDLEVRNTVFSIEVHLTPTKNNNIYLSVVRAIATRPLEKKYNDDLFEEKGKASLKNLEIADEDLPF